jgi:DNA-binding beta-propeller fold protein YncE
MRKTFFLGSILGLCCTLKMQGIFAETAFPDQDNQQRVQLTQSARHQRNVDTTANTPLRATRAWKKTQQTLVRDGIALQLEVEPIESRASSATTGTGHPVRLHLALLDAASRAPLTGLHPSAWMSLSGGEDVPCNARVRAFLRRGLMEKQADLDLNDYQVLVLNQDGTIHVVDPQFSSGRPRLVASIALPGRADDWALSSDQSSLYVSVSQPGEIVMIDTATWEIIHRVKISGAAKLALQPDEHYLWSSYTGTESGVAVLSASDLRLATRIPLRAGRHNIALSNDSLIAFITDPGATSVSVIDVAGLQRIKELKTPSPASSIAFSFASQLAYVGTTDGSILAIREDGAIVSRIQTSAGLAKIAFFGDGRFGFALNPDKGLLHVIDAARNALVQSAKIDAAPQQIAFSDQMAYIVRRDSDLIEMVPLDQLGPSGTAVSTVDLPAGRSSFTHASADELTTTMVQAPGENAVVIANAGDKAVFYYEEGMAAPMGTFSNFGKVPRSVLVVDRSLKEKSPGVYEATGRLEKPGTYIIPVLLDSPRIVECFTVQIGTEEAAPGATSTHP